MQRTFSIEQSGDCLKMSGELDDQCAVETSATVRQLAGVDRTEPFELDLRDVTFIDSIGLRELLKLRKRIPTLRIVAVNPRIERLFAITGTAHLLLD
ncbi:MAG: STAS domain-containing protein [Acidimicrobiales bacterium]